MNALPKPNLRGFSLVELMMAIVVVGVLATVSMPSLRTWFLNAQVRAAAESISNGLQRARAEAVSRNANIEFILGAGTNTSWTVNYAVTPVTPPLDSRASSEGSNDVTRTVTPAGATTITFNNFGGVVGNADGSASLTEVDLNATALDASAASRSQKESLRIIINLGGAARMCDPSLPSTNARGC